MKALMNIQSPRLPVLWLILLLISFFSAYTEPGFATLGAASSLTADQRDLVQFTDVSMTAWYKDAVDHLAANGIVAGIGHARFDPEAPIKRGDFVILMCHALGIVPGTEPVESFEDAGSAYYTPYINMAKGYSLISGVGENCFEPEALIRREEVCVMLEKALVFAKYNIPEKYKYKIDNFDDASAISDYARAAIQRFVNAGWLAGFDRRLMPQKPMTRAEAAQVLYNLSR